MKQWSDPTEEEQVNQIRRIVKQKEMPQESYVNQILERLDHMNRSSDIKRTRKWKKKVAISVTAAAMLGGVVMGSGFVSPVMADALKNVPWIGNVFQYNMDNSLKQASETGLTTLPNLSLTKEGVTLNIKEVMYDGTRLVLAIERQGIEDDTMISPYLPEGAKDENLNPIPTVPLKEQKKGYLSIPDIEIQGNSKFLGSFTDAAGKTEDGQILRNMALYEVSKGLTEKNLPETFDMKVKLNVSGIEEPFEFVVPVKNMAKGAVILHPNQSQKSGDFSYTVQQIELTPVTTRLVLDSVGQVPETPEQTGDLSPTKMYYDIVDQDGNQIQQNMVGYFNSHPGTEYHEDETYQPFKQTPTSITIKPYTLTAKKDWTIVSDSAGKPVKTYHKDLEMTIPVIQK
ncbi:DUF4179 domain-containing protein [Paenibacillus sp. JJ-223]|uniref:DUF4179 domain-containing protein n=1 Tax=Paenibacillus sp. JJ-223 TaxID=2905647 RepID=UPI001F346A21|nr:DUF4179 domain-containing protein [Paenibacillus sp. JJ-223]CAH1191111.1 hypothetical protein PAECIP111890_00303 [Paenibacillus sp. JJ-223]